MGEPALVAAPVQFAITAAPTQSAPVTASDGAQVIFVPSPGPQGPRGPAGNGAQVFNETPAGAVNGSNRVFTTANTFQTGTTCVYINGVRELLNTHYTETSSTTVTLSDAPQTGDDVTIDYLIQ